jgi:EpsI family protein
MGNWTRNAILMTLMLVASAGAFALRPAQKAADQGPKVDLEAMIPSSFAGWQEEKQTTSQIVDPTQQEAIDSIYSSTLSRSYLGSNGERIMLSIAFGDQQNKTSQVHRPDVCYPAQGFSINSQGKRVLTTPFSKIPTHRLVATQGSRVEPITYWIRVGDSLASDWISQKIAIVTQGLHGKISDGLLFRVSSIGADTSTAYTAQDKFIVDLLAASPPETRSFLIGRQ